MWWLEEKKGGEEGGGRGGLGDEEINIEVGRVICIHVVCVCIGHGVVYTYMSVCMYVSMFMYNLT